jgi:hypothetical protein
MLDIIVVFLFGTQAGLVLAWIIYKLTHKTEPGFEQGYSFKQVSCAGEVGSELCKCSSKLKVGRDPILSSETPCHRPVSRKRKKKKRQWQADERSADG